MKIFKFSSGDQNGCPVDAWIHTTASSEMQQRLHPAVVILPGGGYGFLSEREAEPVAERYFAAGFNTFIVRYGVKEQAKDFVPLIQLTSAIAQIRENSAQWFTDPEKIAVCGFSAGGHLACSAGTLFNEPEFLDAAPVKTNIRPDAMILCYPVVTADEYAHVGSIERVSGAAKDSAEYAWFGLDTHVDKQTPPAFIWHTAEDRTVPVENSLKLSWALSRNNIPFELHIFPEGKHGLSVCTDQVNTKNEYAGRWVEMSIQWLNKRFGFCY